MKIYFVAHATSTDNEEGLSSGWNNPELSELGIQQAKELGERFKSIPIDLICCSDLKRAVDTVDIAFKKKIPITIDRKLREINYGDFNGRPKEEVDSMKIEKIVEPFSGGESYRQAVDRVQQFYNELKQKHSDKVILVVGHRATQYGLDVLVNNKGLEELVGVSFKWQPYWEYNF